MKAAETITPEAPVEPKPAANADIELSPIATTESTIATIKAQIAARNAERNAELEAKVATAEKNLSKLSTMLHACKKKVDENNAALEAADPTDESYDELLTATTRNEILMKDLEKKVVRAEVDVKDTKAHLALSQNIARRSIVAALLEAANAVEERVATNALGVARAFAKMFMEAQVLESAVVAMGGTLPLGDRCSGHIGAELRFLQALPALGARYARVELASRVLFSGSGVEEYQAFERAKLEAILAAAL